MFQVLVSTPTRLTLEGYDPHQTLPPKEIFKPMAGLSGAVSYSRVAVFAHLAGQLIRCTSGHLWVTIERDPVDHVLAPNEWLLVTTPGKVIIGGRGTYAI